MSEQTADAVVIGAGVAGLSTAMQLALRGLDVVVVERAGLASGSTSKAAGLIGQMRSNVDATRMLMESVAILKELEERTGDQVFVQTGSLRIAQTPGRVAELKAHVAIAECAGLEVLPVEPSEVASWYPSIRTDDILSAVLCIGDGYLEPPALARSLIAAGRDLAIRYVEHAPVGEFRMDGGRVSGVMTDRGAFSAPIVVNATGAWSYLVAEKSGSRLPSAALGHYYLTTLVSSRIEIPTDSPTFRDRENRIYARCRDGNLRVGMYETSPVRYDMSSLSDDFSMESLEATRECHAVSTLIEAVRVRFPGILPDTPMEFTTGIMSFTPDGAPLIGRVGEIEGLYHCAGFCGHGVSQSPAIGKLMAELVLDGTCRYNLAQLEADRFADQSEFATRDEVVKRCAETYGNYYGLEQKYLES